MRRIACWHDTKAQAEALPDPPPSLKMDAPRVAAATAFQGRYGDMVVTVEDGDSIDVGLALQAQGHRPAVLNLADDCFPGGCVDLGSGAQEESLFRRTNLCRTLTLAHYPLRDGQVVYSPAVTVLKASEADGWRPYPPHARPRLAFIAGPGIRFPICVDADARTGHARLQAHDVARLEAKVRGVLHAAAAHGHDALVLGALGCGAWRSPPAHVAEVMRRVLLQEYDGAFRRVVVAILGVAPEYTTRIRAWDAPAPSNLEAFRAAFGAA